MPKTRVHRQLTEAERLARRVYGWRGPAGRGPVQRLDPAGVFRGGGQPVMGFTAIGRMVGLGPKGAREAAYHRDLPVWYTKRGWAYSHRTLLLLWAEGQVRGQGTREPRLPESLDPAYYGDLLEALWRGLVAEATSGSNPVLADVLEGRRLTRDRLYQKGSRRYAKATPTQWARSIQARQRELQGDGPGGPGGQNGSGS